MDFLQNLFSQKSTEVGRLEMSSVNSVVSTLLNLLPAMGMSNPPIGASTSTKAVSVKKKGKKFIITLNQYNPPISFIWTGAVDDVNLIPTIINIINNNQKIAAINTNKLANGKKFYQLALA